MNNKVISVKNESKLTGFLLLKINNILPNAKAFYSGIINNNSNIRLYKNVFFNNDTSIITYTDGKSFLDKNIYKGVKINPISFDNGTTFNVNYNKKYDLGLHTINNSFPKTLLNVNGNENVFGLYLNNGLKSFWSDIKHGIAVKNFSTNNEQYIPINLNKKTITYTGTNTINNTYNGIININGNGSINYSETVNIINNISSEFKNINYINIPNTLSNEFKLIRNTNYVNVSGLITGFIQNSTIDSNAEITVKTKNNNSFNNNIFYMNDNIKTNISSYLLSGNYNGVAPYLNKNTKLPYNILYNHYHDRYLKQRPTEINYNNIKYHYNSNVPIGSIIWWPESWVTNDITKKQIIYHKQYNSTDWTVCDGHNVTNSLYHKLTQKNKVPNFLTSANYIYRNMYNRPSSIIIPDDHYLNELSAGWVLPRIASIKPVEFYSDGTTRDDNKRTCTYKKSATSYTIETTTTFSPCKSRITFKYGSYQNVSGLTCKFDVTIMLNNYKISEYTQEVAISSGFNTIDILHTITNATKKTATIKCYNFRFVQNNNETLAILPLNITTEDTYISFEDHYRYGFDSQSKPIKANGYTNYGLFRRLVPLIKINDTEEFPYILPPEPVKADTRVSSMLLVRKDVTARLINSLNLDNPDIINAKYLSSCYIPSNWDSFNYNIMLFLEYVKESILSTMTSANITLNGKNSILYTPKDTDLNYKDCYLFKNQDPSGNLIINPLNFTSLIGSNLKQFFNNTNYNDSTFLNVDTRYTNISLSATVNNNSISAYTAYINPQITLLAENYYMLEYILNLLFSLPLQRSVNQPAPNLNYTNLSSYLNYAISSGDLNNISLFGNLPFRYDGSITNPVLINNLPIISSSYYLYGTDVLMWNVKPLTNYNNITSYMNKSRFNARSIAYISNDLQPQSGDPSSYIYGGFPSSYNVLTTWLDTADPSELHNKFFNAMKNTLSTDNNFKYYYPSLLSSAISDYGQCDAYNLSGTTRYIAYPTVKIPAYTEMDIDNNFTYDSISPSNFDVYMNQYDNIILSTNVRFDTAISGSEIVNAYDKRIRTISNLLVNGINNLRNNPDTYITSALVILIYKNLGNASWWDISSYFAGSETGNYLNDGTYTIF